LGSAVKTVGMTESIIGVAKIASNFIHGDELVDINVDE